MFTQLIYMSQPFGFDNAMLSGILATARRNNPQLGITGALICRHDIYLQLIEGDAQAIDLLYARIAADDRHLAVTLLHRAEVDYRLFPDWAMLHDPAQSWLWSPEDLTSEAMSQATHQELETIFRRAAATPPA